MTELDAVNEMLGSIGQASVNSLEEATFGDAAIARGHLQSVNRYVQLYGFAFNTDHDYVLTPDQAKRIWVPYNALRVDPTDKGQDLVVRMDPTAKRFALWDRANHTNEFSKPVPCSVVWGYAFDDLPETAKNYIALAAARRFQKRMIGSDELDGYNAEDEARAWSLLIRDDRANADANLFRKNPVLARMAARRGAPNPKYA